LIVGAAVAVYWNGLDAPFIWDDRTAILDNATIRSLWPPWRVLVPPLETPVSRRPLVNLSFALNYGLHAYDVRGYHVVNLGIHLLTACALFAVIRRALSADSVRAAFRSNAALIALPAALWWALHPAASEIINYTTQRTTALAALLFLMTVYASQRALEVHHRARWHATAVIACVCGVAAKEFVAVAPLVVLLYDRAFAFGSFRRALTQRRRLYGLLATSWLLLGAIILLRPHSTVGFGAGVSPWVYAMNQTGMILRYLHLAFWPDALVLDYGVPRTVQLSDVWASVLGVAMLLAGAIVALIRWPKIGFLCAVFFLLLAPTSSVIPIATEVGSERRMYLPMAALATLLAVGGAWLIEHLRLRVSYRSQRLVTAGCVILAAGWVAALAIRTVQRNEEFASRVTLWRSSVERWPHGRARASYAAALVDAQQRDSALGQLRLAVRDFPMARFALGTELVADGRYREADRELSAFIASESRSANRFRARMLRGRVFVEQGRFDDAIAEYRALIRLRPAAVEPRLRLAHALASRGRVEDAAASYRAALELDPRSHPARVGLAQLLLGAGSIREGTVHAEVAVALNPGSAASHNLLGVALAMDGRLEDALPHFREAVAIDPHDREARNNLARAAHQAGIPPGAPPP
jgi:tetratricopeptide (TPR) repeat protein